MILSYNTLLKRQALYRAKGEKWGYHNERNDTKPREERIPAVPAYAASVSDDPGTVPGIARCYLLLLEL